MQGQRDQPPMPTFLAGGGEMGERTRAHAWRDTPLGPPDAWPSSLKTAVAIVLQCQLPMYLAWGPQFIQFYNDAYRPILGDKPPLAGLHVLVVDDDDDAREVVVRVLQEHGATVTSASGAAEALQRLDSGRFEVLVSDVGMPDVDGHELIRRVRRGRSPHVPALALTAFSREEDRERALAAGFDDFLTKPVEPHRLVQRIALLGRR